MTEQAHDERPIASISVYEEDVEAWRRQHDRNPHVHYRIIGDPGAGRRERVRIRPGKRPPRRPGESPLDPPSE